MRSQLSQLPLVIARSKVPPLVERNITLNDVFFDVWPTSPERALVGGARGKLLLTEDGGRHFKRIKLGSDLAVFGIQMIDAENGYLCGQDGLIMRTRDGGNTWERLNSRDPSVYVFAFISGSAAWRFRRRSIDWF